jgi:hypothetical protein
MNTPQNPEALIRKFVRSVRTPDRVGIITKISHYDFRPFVLWNGHTHALISEWRHLEIDEIVD